MTITARFVAMVSVLVAATAAGYVARRRRWVSEDAARLLMTLVAVVGYPSVGFLTVWRKDLHLADAWLPALGGTEVLLLTGAGLLIAPLLVRSRARRAVFALAAGMGNMGFTMGGFVVYVLYGESGLGLVSVLTLMWTPTIVLALYPLARHYSPREPGGGLGRLIARNLADYRAVGLPVMIVAILLSRFGPPRPAFVERLGIVDVLMFLTVAMAYFSIGLRLRAGRAWAYWRLVAALAGVRFLLAPAVGLALVGLTQLTPLPLSPLARNVFLIESLIPVAITMVAISNMFHLGARVASLLFVTNTLLYLVLVLPWVLWYFAGR